MIKKLTAAKTIAFILFGFILLCLCLGLWGCSSVNKSRSSEHLKEDSNSVHKLDSAVHSFIDSLVEETKGNSSDKTSIEDGENSINIEFDTTNYNKQQPQTKTELTISDSAGVTKITSNKPLKNVNQTSKSSSTKKDVQSSLAITKLEVKKGDSANKKTFDSTDFKKELKIVNTAKEKHRNWLWLLLLLIPIYFGLKWAYNNKYIPLAEWLAKALLFV
jgi:hypothetical protein